MCGFIYTSRPPGYELSSKRKVLAIRCFLALCNPLYRKSRRSQIHSVMLCPLVDIPVWVKTWDKTIYTLWGAHYPTISTVTTDTTRRQLTKRNEQLKVLSTHFLLRLLTTPLICCYTALAYFLSSASRSWNISRSCSIPSKIVISMSRICRSPIV